MQRVIKINVGISFIIMLFCIFPQFAKAETAEPVNHIQILERVTSLTTVIKGQAFPDANITVETEQGLLNSAAADADGKFEVLIAKQAAYTILKITADDGTNTYSMEVTVAVAGWVSEHGQWYFYNNDSEKQTGWLLDEGSWYFLDQKGAMMTGWLLDGGTWYFLKNNGAMQTGWLYDRGWYYLRDSGAMAVGWVNDGGTWYYLGGSGAMKTGWVLDRGTWYYLQASGAMQTGWIYYKNHWYYLAGNGAMAKGWVKDKGEWYFLNPDGSMKLGWIKEGNNWYYLGGSGAVSAVELNAPHVRQMPELPRGCEVTSLAMLLQYAGIPANKMTLATQIRRDPTPYSKVNGEIYFGNPYSGFVGDMYSFSTPGLGVYHGPIAELANQYMPDRIIDFTGSKFEEIYKYLNEGKPVWVIVTSTYDTVPGHLWYKWNTPIGPINITYKEHSVLITGYDSQYIYFNDPLAASKNRKIPISAFKRGWEQLGKQAITFR